jgi:hypothetical protein
MGRQEHGTSLSIAKLLGGGTVEDQIPTDWGKANRLLH